MTEDSALHSLGCGRAPPPPLFSPCTDQFTAVYFIIVRVILDRLDRVHIRFGGPCSHPLHLGSSPNLAPSFFPFRTLAIYTSPSLFAH